MARRSPYIEATIASKECDIKEWHPTTECEHSAEEEVRRLRKLKSNLFSPREHDVPAPQKDMSALIPVRLSRESLLTHSSMIRNYSTSPFLRLPPEVRVRIYGLVLGGKQLWIGHNGSYLELVASEKTIPGQDAQLEQFTQWLHRCGNLYHSSADPSISPLTIGNVIHLGLLRVCRQIYTETALMPYTLNTFTFSDDSTRKSFEQSARPGKKRVQKKAVGKYKIATWNELYERYRA